MISAFLFMINFPLWSDLSNSGLDEMTRNTWEARINALELFRYYFDGDVFEETQPAEVGAADSDIKLYPVGINLVKMLCTALADSFWGEWDKHPVQFGVADGETATDADKAAIKLLNQIMKNSGSHVFWELALDREKFGGGVFKITPALKRKGGVTWLRVPAERFYAIPNPLDPDDILKAFMFTPMTQTQVKAIYGVDPKSEINMVVEEWDKERLVTWMNGEKLNAANAESEHGWGEVPFVYFPRMRASSNWFGDALTDDVMAPQDELNMRVADTGEGINYNFHPTRYGKNLPHGFNAKNYPLGPNSFWDLGRAVGSDSPEVGILEAKNGYGELAQNYIQFLYDWTRTSAFAPPIAFGEDNGGGQRSGITLEIRMWPLMKAERRSRSYTLSGLARAMRITAAILKQKSLPGVDKGAVEAILDERIIPLLAPLMPRDQAAKVDEVVKLRALTPPMISVPSAQEALGRGTAEVDLVLAEAEEAERKAAEQADKAFAQQSELAAKKGMNGNQTDK